MISASSKALSMSCISNFSITAFRAKLIASAPSVNEATAIKSPKIIINLLLIEKRFFAILQSYFYLTLNNFESSGIYTIFHTFWK